MHQKTGSEPDPTWPNPTRGYGPGSGFLPGTVPGTRTDPVEPVPLIRGSGPDPTYLKPKETQSKSDQTLDYTQTRF